MEVIKTERLVIREAQEEDATFIFKLLNNPTWIKFIGERNINNLDDAKMYIQNSLINSYRQNGFGMYLVEEQSSGKKMGLCGLLKREELDHVDIGFAILPEYAGKGYTFEAARIIIEKCPFATIYGITSQDNIASRKLLEKLGMRHVRNFQFGDYKEKSLLFELTRDKANILN
jgi:RimJ/RimL family protein N-acetyltransferase